MQRLLISWIAIRKSKVYRHCETNFATTKDIGKEGLSFGQIEALYVSFAFLLLILLVRYLEELRPLLQVIQRERNCTDIFVPSVLLGLEILNLYLAIVLFFAQSSSQYLEFIPDKVLTSYILKFRLIHRNIVSWR